MAFNPILINREKLTFYGVTFSDMEILNKTANAIGSNMFEGFEPTQKGVEIIRDYVMDKITLADLIRMVKEESYV
jgi:putative transcriptional regulator